MTVNGKNRQYTVRVPNNYNQNKAYKLVFAYHWLSGTMTDVSTGQTVQSGVYDYYGLRRLANEEAIFVAPQGIDNGWANSGGEDITFTDNMLSTIQNGLCVDNSQIFATGWSYGGAMSFSVACSRPNVFRAVAVLSGAQLSGCSGGTTPVAYLGVHGIHDSVLNISNGRSLRDKFVSLNGCSAQSPAEPSQGSLKHVATSYSNCKAGYPVRWIAFDGDHMPAPVDGATGNSPNSYVAPETWNFFSQFSSGTGTTSQPGSTGTTTTKVPTTSTPTPTGTCSALYGQCGGLNYTGPKCCSQGTCKYSNDYYSQCL
jgi:poly(3-hydroxybutyrate) depolymerase